MQWFLSGFAFWLTAFVLFGLTALALGEYQRKKRKRNPGDPQ